VKPARRKANWAESVWGILPKWRSSALALGRQRGAVPARSGLWRWRGFRFGVMGLTAHPGSSRGNAMTNQRGSSTNQKQSRLKERRTLHPNAARVNDRLFKGSDFFDRRDLIQVKYEMLRRVRVDGSSITSAAAAFGLSRPSFYEAQAAFAQDGLLGLLPKKRGPRRRHKLRPPVIAFLREARAADPSLASVELATRVRDRFGLKVHPRSIERALAREGKARRRLGPGSPPPQSARRPSG